MKKELVWISTILILITGLLFRFYNPKKTEAAYVGSLRIDNSSVALFDQIPDAYIAAAAARRVMVRHASIGGNINDGLDDLYGQNSKYNRANFAFENRGNPGWQAKIDDFVSNVNSRCTSFDDLTMKFCVVDYDIGGGVNNYISALESLQNQHQDKNIIWWTMPLTTGGQGIDGGILEFNNQIRNYYQNHALVLFDIADIESHGGLCTDTSWGDPAHEALCTTTPPDGDPADLYDYDSDGAHLNSTGRQRIAKAFWVMMAELSGWNPTGATPTPTPPLLSTPTPNPECGADINNDLTVNIADLRLILANFDKTSDFDTADLNEDSKVNGFDLARVIKEWGRTCN